MTCYQALPGNAVPRGSASSRRRRSARNTAARQRKLMVEQLEPLTMLSSVTVEAD